MRPHLAVRQVPSAAAAPRPRGCNADARQRRRLVRCGLRRSPTCRLACTRVHRVQVSRARRVRACCRGHLQCRSWSFQTAPIARAVASVSVPCSSLQLSQCRRSCVIFHRPPAALCDVAGRVAADWLWYFWLRRSASWMSVTTYGSAERGASPSRRRFRASAHQGLDCPSTWTSTPHFGRLFIGFLESHIVTVLSFVSRRAPTPGC